jgi:hypothetical protein
MTEINQRERRLLIVVIVLAVLTILQLGVLRPIFSRISGLKTKVGLSVRELHQMRNIVDRKDDVATAYEEIRTRITSSRNTQAEIIDMLQTIQQAAEAGKMQIPQTVHVKDEPCEYFNRHTVRFQGQGKIENVMMMLYNLQDPKLLLKIPSMKFAMKNHLINMELEITRVIYTPEAEQPKQ